MKIKPKEKIAIIGQSGNGKTTIFNLLNRFYDLEENSGEIKIDGYNIKDVKVSSLRKTIGYIPTQIELFPGKVYDNISFGIPNVTNKDIENALGYVKLTDRINEESIIDKKQDGNFSTGEKRRICLARIFLLKSPIVIFDEPTNGLDNDPKEENNSTNIVTNAIIEHCKDKTGILISHDINVAEKFADKIVELKNGKITKIIKLIKNEKGEVIERIPDNLTSINNDNSR